MDKDLLAILCCPETRQPLREASQKELAAARLRAGEDFGAGLVREDGKVLYPVREGIPVLIVDQGIFLEA